MHLGILLVFDTLRLVGTSRNVLTCYTVAVWRTTTLT